MCIFTSYVCLRKISRQSDMAFVFYGTFCKCAKRGRKIIRKKMKKLSQFVKSISREHLKRFHSNLVCGVLKLVGVSTAKIVLFHLGSTELWRCKNCIFFLPVNILTGVAHQLASWAARHTTMCLDSWSM